MTIPSTWTSQTLTADTDFTESFGEAIVGGLASAGVSGVGAERVNITAIQLADSTGGGGGRRMVRGLRMFLFSGALNSIGI
jgi:hypothetical protein